ncbi:head maturation protease, ClpP-related [Pseudovibrio exalbescens]|uniref:ATP-dependent Clp protease proteolytic subunit n=1 Tax=Pseudovibrio exalbescens TaxID=197461 RepID=A0A1U7JJY1_9HYPH|nr:head maturation protease, ClpP-related [Pseudovibrio exalbescens]OKL45015.1 peptidase [Pseudovibrio exalbescens]
MSIRELPKARLTSRQGLQSAISDAVLQRWNPDLQASSEETDGNVISILDPIGDNWLSEAVTAKGVARRLEGLGDNDVVVTINSPGGDFFEGLAIYNLLREHKAKVTVKVLGLAASAASIIAMAADEIQVGRAAFLMIHNTWVCACGDRHAFADVAEWLEAFDKSAVSIYAARTGIKAADLHAMLDKETWISGEKAVQQGFADTLLSSDEVDSKAEIAAQSLSANAAQKQLDVLLARLGIPRSNRRTLCAALKGSKSGAASSGMPGAADMAGVQGILAKLQSM